ncbi:MAG: nucleoside hydrolase [Cyanobacteria bacterium HKST-UBA02]|nr:nucleoside hydrolase [Cyanobacteria bacterium HKST-UBA02]
MSPKTETRTRVIIDTDIAAGIPERDIDDALAIVMAANSPSIDLTAVTLTFGNDSLDNVEAAMKELAGHMEKTLPAAARGAARSANRGRETAATRLMANTLESAPATILAIGPLTNIASLIELRPDLLDRIETVVAVAGRKPGQLFRTGAHPRSHPDLNFERDPDAFAALLASGVPVVLAPFEVSSKVFLDQADLDRLAGNNTPVSAFFEKVGRPWLAFWESTFSTPDVPVKGFNPFDTLAVAWLTDRDLLQCCRVDLAIEEDDYDLSETMVQGTGSARKPYLHARPAGQAAKATYIHDVSRDDFVGSLLARLF